MKSLYYRSKLLFLDYVRSESYRKLLPLILLIAFFLIPGKDDISRTLILKGGYRGYFNPAWIGISFTSAYNLIMMIMGYFLIKDRGEILKNLKANRIIGSTVLKKDEFILSVFFAKFFVLLTTLIPMIFVGILALIIKGESSDYNFIPLILPFIVFSIPFLFFLTAITCLFDSIFDGSAGNAVYLIFAFFLINLEMLGIPWTPSGIAEIVLQARQALGDILGVGYQDVGYGVIGRGHTPERFLFVGLDFNLLVIAGRVAIIFLSLLILKSVPLYFDFFKEERLNKPVSVEPNKFFLKIKEFIGRLGLYEISANLSVINYRKFLLIAGVMIFALVSKHRFAYVLLFAMSMDLITKVSNTSKNPSAEDIIKSTNYYPLQIIISFISCVLILCLVNIPLFINHFTAGDFKAVAIVFTGAVFISSMALFNMEVIKNPNIFQLIYLMLIYLMMDANLYLVDFT